MELGARHVIDHEHQFHHARVVCLGCLQHEGTPSSCLPCGTAMYKWDFGYAAYHHV